MIDKSLQEQAAKVASKDDFPINWVDRITLFISHAIKYLIPVIVIVMMYEIFMRYIMEKPTMWVNELCLWLAGICYLVGGIYATRLRSHIRIVMLYDYVERPTQRIF
jgi:TRAP-type C4-dicarboxylate transport system permease small subunit